MLKGRRLGVSRYLAAAFNRIKPIEQGLYCLKREREFEEKNLTKKPWHFTSKQRQRDKTCHSIKSIRSGGAPEGVFRDRKVKRQRPTNMRVTHVGETTIHIDQLVIVIIGRYLIFQISQNEKYVWQGGTRQGEQESLKENAPQGVLPASFLQLII